MKKIFILGTLLCATSATADIPTMQYVLDFYERQCDYYGFADQMKNDLFSDFNPGSIATQWVALNIIDNWINWTPTTYASDLNQNNVMSIGYLQDTLKLINAGDCCIGGLYDVLTDQCVDDCPAKNPRCCEAQGKIWDWYYYTCVDGCPAQNEQCCPGEWDALNKQCKACAEDYTQCCPWDDEIGDCKLCPDGNVYDDYTGWCVTCPGNSQLCCPYTYDSENSKCCPDNTVWDGDIGQCTPCPSGMNVDNILGICLAPGEYSDVYAGTMTTGDVCPERYIVRDDAVCPAGWERVEMHHATLTTQEYFPMAGGWPTDGTAIYSPWWTEDCRDNLFKSSDETSVQVDWCLPPVDQGEIVVFDSPGHAGPYEPNHGPGCYDSWHPGYWTVEENTFWAIGDGCSITDGIATCDTMYVSGKGRCDWLLGHDSEQCVCGAHYQMPPPGAQDYECNYFQQAVMLKAYATVEECQAKCAYDCAYAVQNFTGFRHALLTSSSYGWR